MSKSAPVKTEGGDDNCLQLTQEKKKAVLH